VFLKHSRFILVKGLDAYGFLQGQLTQDMKEVSVETSKWSLILTPVGKIVQLLKVRLLSDNHYLIEVPEFDNEVTYNRLKRFLIRTNAQLNFHESVLAVSSINTAKTDEYLSSFQNGAISDFILDLRSEFDCLNSSESNLNMLFEKYKSAVSDNTFLESELAKDRLLIFESDKQKEQAITEFFKIKSDNLKTFKRLEILYSVLSILTSTFYFDPNLDVNVIPAEIPKLVNSSISFEKGCYVGQELVERIDARSATAPHSIVPVIFDLGGTSDDFVTNSAAELTLITENSKFSGTVLSNVRVGRWLVSTLRIPKKMANQSTAEITVLHSDKETYRQRAVSGFVITSN
jgi:folate-binding protein YgfZ